MVSATVQISAGTFAGDGDVLVTDTTGIAITATYDSSTETLTLTGVDTFADYQHALQSVTFSSFNSNPTNFGSNGTRTITWTVNDGTSSSGPQNSALTISPLAPNPPPPAGTTADMILRGSDASPAVAGHYEIYDIGHNSILAAYSLGQIATDWAFVTLGRFNGSDTTDMMLRNIVTGAFEVYDISNNNNTNAAALGTVGLEWEAAGFADFNHDGMTDMLLRNSNTGAFEVYNISNNSILMPSRWERWA